MKDNLLDEAREVSLYEVLSYYNMKLYKNSCKCIFHTDENRSAFISNKNKFHCKSCGAKGLSTIDIVQFKENIRDLRAAAKKVLEIKGTTINTISYFEKNNKPIKERKQLSFSDRKNLAENKNINVLVDYLNSRCISKNVLPILKANNITYGADKLNQVHFFFNRQGYCIYRSANSDKNYNCGNTVPICIKSNETKTWYIVEGIYDGLSLIQFKKNVIVLNSVSNKDKFLDKFNSNENMFKFEYIIATDNDTSGIGARDNLINFFKENKIKYNTFKPLYNSKYKDVNDMLREGELNEYKTTIV